MLNADYLLESAARLKGQKVLIVGDLMLDHYVIGSVERISPEAPVPVVRVSEEKHLLGGAGNVALNIARLGGEPVLVALAGNDRSGDELVTICEDENLNPQIVRSPRPTTLKTRILAHNQQVVRVDNESDCELDEDELNGIFNVLQRELKDVGVIILSDYGKGVICKQFMARLREMMSAMDNAPKVFVDPKTRNYDLYNGVDLLTPNTKEAAEGAAMSGVKNTSEVMQAGDRLFDRLECNNLLITLGAEGMALFQGADSVVHIPTTARKVFDVTGAGDTVIATLSMAVAAGLDLTTSSVLANYAAGLVVAQVGAATTTLEDLSQCIREQAPVEVSTWK